MPRASGRRRLSIAAGHAVSRATAEVRLAHPLHARAAARVVGLATTVGSRLTVSRATGTDQPADARSVLALLALRLDEGEVARVEGYGDDAERAVAALAALLVRDAAGEASPR